MATALAYSATLTRASSEGEFGLATTTCAMDDNEQTSAAEDESALDENSDERQNININTSGGAVS